LLDGLEEAKELTYGRSCRFVVQIRSTRCWLQPEEVWINKPPEEHELALELPMIEAACVAAQE
jgi:hypothetical protein